MTKDEATAEVLYESRGEAFYKAFGKRVVECREKGFREPNTTDYGMGFGDGYEAAIAAERLRILAALGAKSIMSPLLFDGGERFDDGIRVAIEIVKGGDDVEK